MSETGFCVSTDHVNLLKSFNFYCEVIVNLLSLAFGISFHFNSNIMAHSDKFREKKKPKKVLVLVDEINPIKSEVM